MCIPLKFKLGDGLTDDVSACHDGGQRLLLDGKGLIHLVLSKDRQNAIAQTRLFPVLNGGRTTWQDEPRDSRMSDECCGGRWRTVNEGEGDQDVIQQGRVRTFAPHFDLEIFSTFVHFLLRKACQGLGDDVQLLPKGLVVNLTMVYRLQLLLLNLFLEDLES